MQKICIVYSHHKLGDLIWQLPYIKSISDFHKNKVHLMLRDKTQAKDILKDLDHIQSIEYNNFRKGFYYWIDTIKLLSYFKTVEATTNQQEFIKFEKSIRRVYSSINAFFKRFSRFKL